MPRRTTLKPIAAICAKSSSVGLLGRRDRGVAQVVVDQLVHVDAAQEHPSAGDVADDGQPVAGLRRQQVQPFHPTAGGDRRHGLGARGLRRHHERDGEQDHDGSDDDPGSRTRAVERRAAARAGENASAPAPRDTGRHCSDQPDAHAVPDPRRNGDQRRRDPPAVRPRVVEVTGQRRNNRPDHAESHARDERREPDRQRGLAGKPPQCCPDGQREQAEEHTHPGQRAERARGAGGGQQGSGERVPDRPAAPVRAAHRRERHDDCGDSHRERAARLEPPPTARCRGRSGRPFELRF